MMKLSRMVPKLRRNPETNTLDGEHALLTGQTRFGKTYLAKRILRFFPYVLIHDPKDRFFTGWEYEHRVHSVDELYGLDPDEHPWVVYAPPRDELHDPRAQEAYCRYVFERGNCCAVFDELVRIATINQYPPHLKYLYTNGAEESICVIGLSQEPINLPSFALTQAAHRYTFYIGNSSHRDKLAGFMPLENSDRIAALQKKQFLYWSYDQRNVTGPWWIDN